MLKNASKIAVFLIIFGFSACSTEDESRSKREEFVNEKQKYLDYRSSALEYSQQLVGYKDYQIVYSNLCDTMQNWVTNKLRHFSTHSDSTKIIDLILCFNAKGDKFITTYLSQSTNENNDYIEYLYGVKIENQWYFYDPSGGVMLTRKYYQNDKKKPLSFDILRLLAGRYVYSGYLKRKWWLFGNYVINDDFFKEFDTKNKITIGYGECLNCKTQDEYYLYLVKKNWSERNQN